VNSKEVKKVQLGGWTGRKYKEVRQKIKKMLEKELGFKLK